MKINSLEDLKDLNIEYDQEVQEDKTIICVDCGKEFVFDKGQQEFFNDKGLKTPKRCKQCSKKRREFFLNLK